MQIDLAHRLIDRHRPNAAIELLEDILGAVREGLDHQAHFGILSNLGNANLLLLDASKAASFFLEAAKYAPELDDRPAAQHAHAHVLLGELRSAQRVASKGAERLPRSSGLKAVLLFIADQDGRLEDPEDAVTAFGNDHHVAYTLAQIYARRDDSDRSAKWIKIAHRADPNSWQGRKAFAKILLRRAVEQHVDLVGGTTEVLRDFEASAAELEKIWDVVHAGEPIEASAVIAAQVATARKVANDRDGARRACEAGLAMGFPSTLLLQIASSLATEDGRFGDAIGLLRQIDAA